MYGTSLPGTGAMATTRVMLIAAAIAAVLGMLALAGYSWLALDHVSREADVAHAYVARIWTIERLEESVESIIENPGSVAHEESMRALIAELETAAFASERDSEVLDTLRARLDGVPEPGWLAISQQLERMEARAIRRSEHLVTSEPARERATRLARFAAIVVCVFGLIAGVFYFRLRRQQREALDELRNKDRLAALGTLAASVAHEINNPLATIAGCADALRGRFGNDENAAEYLGMIAEETRRCSAIVGNLGDLARERAPAMTIADLGQLARDVVGLLEMNRSDEGVTVRVDGEESVELMADPDKLKQLLLNLMVNARDACEPGGEVTVRVGRDGDAALLEVHDDGRGLSPRELSRVFEPFHTGKARGLGLGLFLCERIVALHGGSITAASDGPGRGATFIVRLPTRTGEAA